MLAWASGVWRQVLRLRPGAGTPPLPALLQLSGTRLPQLGLDAGPGAAPPGAPRVVVAAVRAHLLLVQALCLPELGSAGLKTKPNLSFF